MKRLFCIILILVLVGGSARAQKRGNVWCFGHEAAINFNSGFPVADSSSVISRGSCASICDTSGELLFYTAYDTIAYISGSDPVKVYSSDHQVMSNGDSIKGGGWYYELVIIPDPSVANKYYLFNIGVTFDLGIYYSVVDMSLNGGMGGVIQKNVQLQNFANVDCITAIKHGNGRDWWIYFRQYNQLGSNNLYYRYLVSTSGISNVYVQTIGSLNSTNLARMGFDITGTKMMFTNLRGQMESFDFDRCTGLLSNPLVIFPEQISPFTRLFWGSQFSPSGNLFYVTHAAIPGYSDSCYLVQYNLDSPNIALSADTIFVGTLTNSMGAMKLGPDHKIYLTGTYNNFVTSSYPYPDTVYSIYNSYLGVINSPDSIGIACDFQPYSFYLGGKRTYYGLPNNPDYDLPALAGSPCDTLVSIGEAPQIQQAALNVFYHTAWEKAFINASNLKGKNGKLLLYDMQGKIIHREPLRIQNGYYTRDLSMQGKARGVYLVIVQTEEERLARKMITE